MSEAGAEVPKISIEDKAQAAKRALQEGNQYPAQEIATSISNELSQHIEHKESSNDPQAYWLRSVVTDGRFNTLKYLLEPPVDSEASKKIKMVYLDREAYDVLNTVTLLDKSSETDPYHEFAENDARGIKIRYDKEAKIAFLDDIEQVYSNIAAHGIRKDPGDFTVIHHGRTLAPWFEEYIKSLPFTGKLKFSPVLQRPPEARVRTAADEAALERWQAKIAETEAQQQREAKAERRLAEERDRKEAEDKTKINELLSKPGVKDVLRKFSEKFNQEAGREFIYGITSDGLVVAVRQECSDNESGDDYYKAWVLDANLSPDEIEKNIISTSFNLVNVGAMHDSGISYYRSNVYSLSSAPLSDEEIEHRVFPPSNTQLVQFLKKTGGLAASRTSASYRGVIDKPTIGGERTLYPLDLT